MSESDSLAEAALIVDQIEDMVARAEHAKAQSLLDDLLPMVGKGVAAFQGGHRVSFHAGMCYVLVRLQRSEKAHHHAELALLNDPQDVVIHAILSESQKLYFAREFIRRRRSGDALAILELLRESTGSAAALEALALLSYFANERSRISGLSREVLPVGRRRPLLMNIVVWGKDYVQPLLDYGLPSLLADGNIPACATSREVILDIYTSASDRPAIQESGIGLEAARYATLNFNILPDDLLYPPEGRAFENADRWCTGGSQLCSALRAYRIGADVSFICSSGVYSRTCFTAAQSAVDDGYSIIMNCTPRAKESERYGALQNFADLGGGHISISAESLVSFIVENLHPHCENLFVREPPQTARQDPTTLYFKTVEGYATRTFQPSPLIISHDLLCDDFTFDYMTTDARFAAELLQAREPDGVVKIASNPQDDLVVVDVDCGESAGMKEYADLPVTGQMAAFCALGTAYRESDLTFYRWLMNQRFVMAGDNSRLLESTVTEDELVRQFMQHIERGEAPVLERMRVYDQFAKD